MIKSYKELTVWQESEKLFEEICDEVKTFPNHRIAWTIGDQLVRAVGSIGANIAEWFNRYTKSDILHFWVIAYGSAAESEVWINRAIRQDLISQSKEDYYSQKIVAIQKMLGKLKSSFARS